MEDWADKWGFKVSAAKSKFLIFGYKRKTPDFGLCMYGFPLERVKELKFLGFWFEERMTWAVHVKNILLKCDKVLNIMRSLAGCDWGAERGSMHLVYQAMIRSSIDYGCFVYGSAAQSVLRKLDTLQAKALRLCCGAFRTSPY